MQTLDVISVNLWQILISLLNLFLLFLIMKHFLYKPVKKVLAKRQAELDGRYESAAAAEAEAEKNRFAWEEKLSAADDEADAIVKNATELSKRRFDAIVADAKEEAHAIIRSAKGEAELERRRAADDMKREIVEISGAISEKLLEREITTEDHRALIDSFIEKVGEGNE